MGITVIDRLERFMSKIDINCQPSLITMSMTLGSVNMIPLYGVSRMVKPISFETYQHIPQVLHVSQYTLHKTFKYLTLYSKSFMKI